MIQNMVKVSILIPVYNTEKYLVKCLESAINQTLKEIEIIIINDASTDSSLQIIKSYVKNDSRIKLINFNENKGNGYGRNEGIRSATGEFILFLDSDDWLEENTAELTYNKASSQHLSVVLFGYKHQLEKNDKEKFRSKLELPLCKDNDLERFNLFLLGRKGVGSMPWIYLFSRKFLMENDIYFAEGIYFEDSIFVAKSIFLTTTFGVISDIPLYNYRVREGSILRSYSKKKIDDNFKSNHLIKDFMLQRDVFEQFKVEYNVRLLTYCIFNSYIDYFHIQKKNIDVELRTFMESRLRKSQLLSQLNLNQIKIVLSRFDFQKEKDLYRFMQLSFIFLSGIKNDKMYLFQKISFSFGYRLGKLLNTLK